MATVSYFPVPGRKKTALNNSFGRIYIPGTWVKYSRARAGVCCARGCGWGHGGIDMPANGSFPLYVYAVWPGVIRTHSFGSAYGQHQVTVVAPDGHGAFYAHMDRRYVVEGQRVRAGQLIGRLDTEGQTTGAHLHFEHRKVWSNWCSAINPYTELEAARKKLL